MNPNNDKKTLLEGKFKRFISHQGWEYVERVAGSGVVAIVAMTEDNKVIFVEQYRIPVARSVIEFPAGVANDLEDVPDESLEAAARREFLEETGYQAEHFTFVGRGPAASASLADVITLYRATGLKKVAAGGGDATESITVHEVEYDKVDEWLTQMQKNGRYVDPKVYAGLYFLNKG